jgi:hypothetical protein
VNTRLLLLSVPLLCCACGSSGPPSAKDAQAAVRHYFDALGDGNPDGVCHDLSPAAQRQVAAAARMGSCKQAATALAKAMPDSDKRKLKGAKISAAHVTGKRATIVVTTPGHTSTVPLEVRDGRWQISRLSTS